MSSTSLVRHAASKLTTAPHDHDEEAGDAK